MPPAIKPAVTALEGIQRLWYEVIATGVKRRDISYFLGDDFKYHCHLLGLDNEYMVKKILEKLGGGNV